ncbi:MAG: FKBP-type peptidyl-prolyl cis-trans isomerase [Opitutaceae bacterium]
MRFSILFGALLCIGILPAPRAHAQGEPLSPDDLAYVYKTWPQVKETSTGIRYFIEKPGHGKPPGPGDLVGVLYTGWLLHGKEFDRETNPKHPFTFRVQRYAVIKGWDQIVQFMKPGEKRFVIIPSTLAYGTEGRPPLIPPDATLLFEMHLVSVQREPPAS